MTEIQISSRNSWYNTIYNSYHSDVLMALIDQSEPTTCSLHTMLPFIKKIDLLFYITQ